MLRTGAFLPMSNGIIIIIVEDIDVHLASDMSDNQSICISASMLLLMIMQ